LGPMVVHRKERDGRSHVKVAGKFQRLSERSHTHLNDRHPPRSEYLTATRLPIRSISFFTYRTRGGGWTPAQVGVYRFVRAIKKEPLAARPGGPDTGYVLVNGTEPKRLIRPKNAH